MEINNHDKKELKDINDEWEKFKLCYSDSDLEEEDTKSIVSDSSDVSDLFYNDVQVQSANLIDEIILPNNTLNTLNIPKNNLNVPLASDIYVSTTTKTASICSSFDLNKLFWEIPIMPYVSPKEGVVKKQMKINSTSVDDIELINEKLKNTMYYKELIITKINNPSGRIKFKDVRKITVGISKKDILSHRSKEKSAFYNCFVLIIRMKIMDIFKEFHVKVFNTGIVTVPGIKSETGFVEVVNAAIKILQPFVNEKLNYTENTSKTILINTNFNCGFYINREKLHNILCQKYNIQSEIDPCNYPGIRCIFYYDPDAILQKGYINKENKHTNIKEVSFMIFRTGSVLISGTHHDCKECVLTVVYEFLKKLLHNEYHAIHQPCPKQEAKKVKQKKIRKKNITVTI
jgi:hypothetical protein